MKSLLFGLLFCVICFFTAATSYGASNVNAWGDIDIENNPGIPIGSLEGAISLSCAPNPRVRFFSGKFQFSNVPTNVPCNFEISVNTPAGWANYRSTYKFTPAGFLAGHDGRKAAGQMGKFVVNLRNATISEK